MLRPPWSPPPPPGSVAPIVRLSGTALLAARDLNEGHPTPSTLLHPRSNSVVLPEGFFFFIKVAPCSYDGAPHLHDHAPDPHTHTHTHTLLKANSMSFPTLLKSSCWESSWSADCALPPPSLNRIKQRRDRRRRRERGCWQISRNKAHQTNKTSRSSPINMTLQVRRRPVTTSF